ncbi:hypothetical protein SLE2022_313870 [Rubroshorea leprosula]
MGNSIDNYSLVSFLFLVSLSSVVHIIRAAGYVPTEKFLLNCGDTSLATAEDGRKWAPDVGSKLWGAGNSVVSKAATQDPAVPSVPYMSARIFRSNFTYSFPVVAGRKFIRLYFYSSSYDGLHAANALFSVTAGSYTLLRNFNVSQTSEALNYAFLIREYSVNVDGEMLNITFSPSSMASNAYAFVNGIEVMSMPDIYSNTGGRLMIVGYTTPFTIDNSTALETVYRLNVGGNDISPSEDDTGLFRSWSEDLPYILGAGVGVTVAADPNMTFNYKGIPRYTAPKTVYATARSMGPYSAVNAQSNLTWLFSVDSGFNYLIRLHFCEFTESITLINQRVFNIFLNNQTAQEGADVIAWAGGNWNIGVPVYMDFVVLVPGGGPQQDLWLELHPDIAAKPQYYDAILSGVEIFKLSHTSGNLAELNPIPAPKNEVKPSLVLPSHSDHSNLKVITAVGISGGVALALIVGFYLFAASRRHKHGMVPGASDDPENTALIKSDNHGQKDID